MKVTATCLEIFTSGSANQPLDDAHDLPEAGPPTRAIRTKRALRSAPVVLVRSVRMPAYAEAGTSFIEHSLRSIPVRSGGEVSEQLKARAGPPVRAARAGKVAGRRSYAVRMSDSPLSLQEIRTAATAYAELGPEYSDAVVASFLARVDQEIAARAGAPGRHGPA